MQKSNIKIAIPTDAISMDIETSILIGLDWGIKFYELKRIFNKRLPAFNDKDIEYIKKTIKKNNIKICSLSPGILKGKVDSDLTSKEVNDFDRLINFANEFETNRIVVFGFEFEKLQNLKDNKTLSKINKIYEKLIKKCEKNKISLLIENDRGQLMNNQEILLQTLNNFSKENLKVNWDPCNCIGEINSSKPFPDFYSAIKDRIGHLHIKDAIKTENGYENTMIGKGEVNWKGQIKELKKNNYNGYYVIEPHYGHRIHSTFEHIKSFKEIFESEKI